MSLINRHVGTCVDCQRPVAVGDGYCWNEKRGELFKVIHRACGLRRMNDAIAGRVSVNP